MVTDFKHFSKHLHLYSTEKKKKLKKDCDKWIISKWRQTIQIWVNYPFKLSHDTECPLTIQLNHNRLFFFYYCHVTNWQKVWKGLFLHQQSVAHWSSVLNQAQDIQLLQPQDALNVSVTHLLRARSDTETAQSEKKGGKKEDRIPRGGRWRSRVAIFKYTHQ